MTVVAASPKHTKAKPPRRAALTWAVAGVLTLGTAGALYAVFSTKAATTSEIAPSQLFTVAPMDLEVKITKDGEIHAVDNIDITCKVEGSSTITTLVREGSSVKKGDELLTLDSTEIRQKIEDTDLSLKKSEAEVSNSSEMYEIQKTENDTKLESAQVSFDLAKLDLEQYEKGSYPQQLATAQTEVEMARITLNNRLDDLATTKRLFLKNFVTETDVKKADLDVLTARNALAKAETALKVLTEYTHQMELTSRKNTVAQSDQRISRTKRENASNLSWRKADLDSRTQSLIVLKRRYERLQEQLAACSVKAPADGMVIYGSMSDRGNNTQIAEGVQVRERQLLLRLPDTSSMKAVVRIHESMVSKIQEGQRARITVVGFKEPVWGTLSKISVVADSSNRFWNPDLREYPIDVALDNTLPNLKPGIGANVEIFIDRLTGVLAVPVDSVYTVGRDRYVFTRQGEQILPRKVTVGANNETHVQISEGLETGQQVMRLAPGQGRELLEKAGIKLEPTSQPADARGGKRSKPRPAK